MSIRIDLRRENRKVNPIFGASTPQGEINRIKENGKQTGT